MNLTKATSNKAKELDGSYAGYQPKPAVEVIIVVMKPLSEKSYTDQAMMNKKGITWLDDCRIPFQDSTDLNEASKLGNSFEGKSNVDNSFTRADYNPKEQGRFPANLLVSDNILDDGKITTTKPDFRTSKINNDIYQSGFHRNPNPCNDTGQYSRYFNLNKWAEKLPFLNVPKASKSERNKGLQDLEIRKMEYETTTRTNKETADKFGCERKSHMQNNHPTVKPIKLMSYLITLGSREGDLILDPFCGSGTTGIAALNLHRRFLGVELNPEYVRIAEARIKPILSQNRIGDYNE